jgi:hypothetical protein
MSRYAIVIGTSVTNIIMADDEATALAVSPSGAIAVEVQESDRITQTWTYDGTNFIDPGVNKDA